MISGNRFLKTTLLFISFCPLFIFAQIQDPITFFGDNRYGKEFIYHNEVVDYFHHVAENSDMVTVQPYGKTNEHRPLLLAFVSTPENIRRLEEIRSTHIDDLKNHTSLGNTTIVWLSHSVHGNESAGTESAPQTLYRLVTDHQDWLRDAIVIIDPAVNPDGFSRYVNWKNESNSRRVNPHPEDREHVEPWPGGRYNHYYFDLNRDWAWQTQIESQQRAIVYHQWLPHVHVDLHEMGVNSPYYFAPAAAPYHDYITPWQREFQTAIGKNNARYFDNEGWLYFTKEVFDLFYPSYGDTYPTYTGSIGMTYEQGGSGRAGRSVRMDNEELLTIGDRMEHHTTASLSTVEISTQRGAELRKMMIDFYAKAKPGKYKSYLIKADPSGEKINDLATLLERLHIDFGSPASSGSVTGYQYSTGRNGSSQTSSSDIIINADQFNGLMAQMLFEPSHHLVDSNTYDITAWSLPYAYGLEAFGLNTVNKNLKDYSPKTFSKNIYADAYTYIVPWTGTESAKAVASLHRAGVKLRKISAPMTTESGISADRGSLLITKADNASNQNLVADVKSALKDISVQVYSAKTGFVKSGYDFGSGRNDLVADPKIAIIYGENVSPLSYGHLKYYLEQTIDVDYTAIPIDRIKYVDWTNYETLILPEGWYTLSDDFLADLQGWVRKGNHVICIGSAVTKLADKEGFSLTSDEESQEESASNENKEKLENYHKHERDRISNFSPGAIIKYDLDNTHPLGYGLPSYYFSLKDNSITFPGQTTVWNVATVQSPMISTGFIGHNVKKKLPGQSTFLVEEMGRGKITYLSDPVVYRGFWKNGAHLLSNALYMVR